MTGSNRRPSACKADALPAELILHLMVTRTGFEPVYACVKGMCVKPLHQRAILLIHQFIFIMAEQEGFEPSRWLPDLYP